MCAQYVCSECVPPVCVPKGGLERTHEWVFHCVGRLCVQLARYAFEHPDADESLGAGPGGIMFELKVRRAAVVTGKTSYTQALSRGVHTGALVRRHMIASLKWRDRTAVAYNHANAIVRPYGRCGTFSSSVR